MSAEVTQQALANAGGLAAVGGSMIAGIVAVLKWVLPFAINLWSEKGKELASLRSENIAKETELEKLRQKSAQDTLDELRRITGNHGEQLLLHSREMQEMRGVVTTMNGHMVTFLSYRPTLDKMAAVFDRIKEKESQAEKPSAARDTHPSTVRTGPGNLQVGPDAVLVRSKKTGDAAE